VISTMAGIPAGARNRQVAEALITNLHRFVKVFVPARCHPRADSHGSGCFPIGGKYGGATGFL
jgi:hypothetical protein